MSGGWAGSDRRLRLPTNWPSLVITVKKRASTQSHPSGQCEALGSKTGLRCKNAGRDVDHIIPGDDHDLSNLRLLCIWHHGKKSSREGNEAQASRRLSATRPPERHPGVKNR